MHDWLTPMIQMTRRRRQLVDTHDAMERGVEIDITAPSQAHADIFLGAYAKLYPGEPLPPVVVSGDDDHRDGG